MKKFQWVLTFFGCINLLFATIYGLRHEYSHATFDLVWAFLNFYLANADDTP